MICIKKHAEKKTENISLTSGFNIPLPNFYIFKPEIMGVNTVRWFDGCSDKTITKQQFGIVISQLNGIKTIKSLFLPPIIFYKLWG